MDTVKAEFQSFGKVIILKIDFFNKFSICISHKDNLSDILHLYKFPLYISINENGIKFKKKKKIILKKTFLNINNYY